ncbi:uncharacterized protein [Diabrotica undecimpunctata]|uniref:uncharacterized protein n=1 Tax=Diabrotica undecimpunctata TaxID=50387 RepID=UPI003B639CC2
MSDTNSADELANIPLTPPKKRSKKGHLSVDVKEIIVNVYKHELQENPALILSAVEKRVADKVGVSDSSVFKVIREYKTTHTLVVPKKCTTRKGKLESVDDFDKVAIRRIVHQFFFRNEIPTIDRVLQQVNDDPNLPDFKRTTFYKLLKKLQFKFEKRGRNSMLTDRDDLVIWRREFLRQIKDHRNGNRKIYYLDETWINAGHTKSKTWIDKSVTSSRQAFLDGLSTGLKNPSGKGKRLIICHIGSEDGFVVDALWSFESKKSGDYHEEMDGKGFESWFEKTLPKLEANSVIVMDNASYHSRKSEKIPTTSSRKADIQEWLHLKSIPFDDSLLKVQLLALVNQHKKQYDKYIIDEMAKSQNKIVLRLPPYHCELNPIELIWADIKNYVAAKNTTFKFADMKNLFDEALSTITPQKWKNCVQHITQKVEPKMWELDNLVEARVDSIIINPDDDSTSSFSE